MTAHNDLDRQLNDFLRDGPTELPYESFDAVRDRTEQTGQRVVIGPWRLPEMNKILTIGLAAAFIAAETSWRVPFMVFAFPTALFVVLAGIGNDLERDAVLPGQQQRLPTRGGQQQPVRRRASLRRDLAMRAA